MKKLTVFYTYLIIKLCFFIVLLVIKTKGQSCISETMKSLEHRELLNFAQAGHE